MKVLKTFLNLLTAPPLAVTIIGGLVVLALWEYRVSIGHSVADAAVQFWHWIVSAVHWLTADIYIPRYQRFAWLAVGVVIGSIVTALTFKWAVASPPARVPTAVHPRPAERELEILWFIASYDGNPVEVAVISNRFGLKRLQTNQALNNLGSLIRPASGGSAIDEVLGTPYVRLTPEGADFCEQQERLPGMRNARTY